MNGREHYAEAERLLRDAGTNWADGDPDAHDAQVAAAAVHATLATIPPDHLAVYDWTQQRLIERLTEDHCLTAFRDAWQRADAENAHGDRVRRGIEAAIKAALL